MTLQRKTPMPRGTRQLARTPWPVPPAGDSGVPLRWSSLKRSKTAATGKGGVVRILESRPRPVARSTIPADVLALVDARDGHFCVRCGRYRDVIEHHHRRVKGTGGDTRPHTECACCIVSLCPWWTDSACHPWVHRSRAEAEAEGLIIPRAAGFPFLYPVLVHGQYDAGGAMAWPTCAGAWSADEPDGAAR